MTHDTCGMVTHKFLGGFEMADVSIYGIDHGNGNMKMEHAEAFPCGIVRQNIEPVVFGNMEYIKYENAFYMLTDRRMPYKADKSTDLDYFILTLFALVHEAKARNMLWIFLVQNCLRVFHTLPF